MKPDLKFLAPGLGPGLATCLALSALAVGAPAVRAGQPGTMPPGQRLYERHCAACHAGGPDRPGTVALATRYQGEVPGELVLRSDLTPEYVAMIARTGIGSMPPFRKTEIGDAELAALASWLAEKGQERQ